jgi:serine O-acetyltransferase
MFRNFIYDAQSMATRDPAARGIWEVILLYSGFHALLFYRFANMLYRMKLFFLARMISQIGRFFTGVEIHPGAKIGHGLFIDHGMGIVIGETAVIGDDCTIYHGVTLGGTGKETGKRHPTIGNNVLIGAGAKILGPFRVGDNARIAANAVVLHEVPDGATVVGVPGHIVRHKGAPVKPATELDQIDVPDAQAQEVCKILKRLRTIEQDIKKIQDCGDFPNESEKQVENNGEADYE